MDVKLACGDYTNESGATSRTYVEKINDEIINKLHDAANYNIEKETDITDTRTAGEISHNTIDANEMRLKERISNCKKIIHSLKLELTEEKSKLEEETKNEGGKVSHYTDMDPQLIVTSRYSNIDTFSIEKIVKDNTLQNYHKASFDRKLKCDENLMEYEKQLQKYQNTLNIAQIEKKNVIRKQMLAKAYKLKLLEVENQCNIELLRVKQSLQCLEPLQMIVKKWKVSDEPKYDINSFELIPRYPEIDVGLKSDLNSTAGDNQSQVVSSD